MADAQIWSEIIDTLIHGIQSLSKTRLNTLFEDREADFPEQEAVRSAIDRAMRQIVAWDDLHKTPMMRPHVFYSLVHALVHYQTGGAMLNGTTEAPRPMDDQVVLANLSMLAEALAVDPTQTAFREFVEGGAATTRPGPRTKRFTWIRRALEPTLLTPT